MMTQESVNWTVARAKARLSELIDRALSDGPQVITRNGRRAAVVVSAEEWDRKTRRKGSLAEFFAASPLRDSGLVIERIRDGSRDIEL
ncbi:MAG TPA: type II toxin-antitoxin system Phd/YefM family antitoxin [Dehalococcoidia bacterium]|nr:type II toxin-antitoxin system Phd/YefM family antitoxin [Dehalococcoidia bacterium]